MHSSLRHSSGLEHQLAEVTKADSTLACWALASLCAVLCLFCIMCTCIPSCCVYYGYCALGSLCAVLCLLCMLCTWIPLCCVCYCVRQVRSSIASWGRTQAT